MLRFSVTVGSHEGKASRDEQKTIRSFYHIEVAVLCPVQKNWLISNHLKKKNNNEVNLNSDMG